MLWLILWSVQYQFPYYYLTDRYEFLCKDQTMNWKHIVLHCENISKHNI